MNDRNIEKLIYEMLSRQNKVVIDRILPWLERLEANQKFLRKEQEERVSQLEAACSDLAAEIHMLKAGRDIQGSHVRPD